MSYRPSTDREGPHGFVQDSCVRSLISFFQVRTISGRRRTCCLRKQDHEFVKHNQTHSSGCIVASDRRLHHQPASSGRPARSAPERQLQPECSGTPGLYRSMRAVRSCGVRLSCVGNRPDHGFLRRWHVDLSIRTDQGSSAHGEKC